jgi:hypothetical protein
MRLRAVTFALLATAVPAAASPAPATDEACSMVYRRYVRSDSATYFTFTATRDSVVAGTRKGRGERQPPWSRAEPDTATVLVRGQVVRLERVRGWSAARIGTEPRRGVVVAWDLGSACERLAPHRALGFRPADRVFLEVGPRPERAWVRAMPTFDVHVPLHRYVPAEYGHRPGEAWWRGLLRRRPISVDEYLRMYEALPMRRQWEADPESASRRVYRWARANPGIARREPARSIIREMEGELRHLRQQKGSPR